MSKSLGNSILPNELFTGEHHLLSQAYSPMVLRFFFLRSHYRSVCDFSDASLQASEKSFNRLMQGLKTLRNLEYIGKEKVKEDDDVINKLMDQVYEFMSDDFNTPRVLATLFELVSKINSIKGGQIKVNSISKATLERLQTTLPTFVHDVLGLQEEAGNDSKVVDGLMNLIISMRQEARANKNWAVSDQIRDELKAVGIQLKDSKGETSWIKE